MISFQNPWKFQVLRFGFGGCISTSLKLILLWIFQKGGLPLWLNYAIVHCLIVFVAYGYHSQVTFRMSPSVSYFFRFLASVAGLKLLDYGLVVVVNNIEFIQGYVYELPYVGTFVGDHLVYFSVISTTLFIFFLRYFLFKKVVFLMKQ